MMNRNIHGDFSRNRTSHLFLRFVFLLVLFLGLTSGSAYLLKYGILKCNFLAIEEINFTGINYVNENSLEFKFTKLLDRNIYNVQDIEIQRIAKYFPGIKSIQIFRFPPHKIKIKVIERQPIAYVKNDFAKIYIIDHEGVLLEEVRNCREHLLPIFEDLNINNLTLGEEIEDMSFTKLMAAYNAINLIGSELMNRIISFRIENKDVILTGRNKGQRFIIGEDDFVAKTGKLVFAFDHFASSDYSEIDLRFSDLKNDLVILRNN
ncbi:MAG: FtsQ-type POTRA domain-containing protein [Candidatus Cloacimonadota bacterium]|nr:FtsQ-type POTRA domain-containing protein [Candidatus Cloacimonadota bacterium]